MKCPVCDSLLAQLFRGNILNKFDIIYYKCNRCGLIKTQDPYWLEEAYSDAIADLDTGIVARNIELVQQVRNIIEEYFDSDGVFLDYAGGYGLFVRMMRDEGFNFYRQDKYCQNIFAKHFDIKDRDIKNRFELITAFEFLEHVVVPLQEIASLLALTDTVLFSTELLPENITCIDDWWYFVPETGQHITFYSKKTFECIADKLGINYYVIGENLHLLTRRKFDILNFQKKTKRCSMLAQKLKAILPVLSHKAPVQRRRKSLVWSDYQYIKKSVMRVP